MNALSAPTSRSAADDIVTDDSLTEVRLRPLAEDDLVGRAAHYFGAGGDALGDRFFQAALQGLDRIGLMPGVGSLRLGELYGVPGLRSRKLDGFPCGWFYLKRSTHVDVVRLLACSQDLSDILGTKSDDPVTGKWRDQPKAG